MNNVTKRLIAYFVDVLVIMLISSLICQIKFINPYLDKYEETTTKYVQLLNSDNVSDLKVTDVINLTYQLDKYGIAYYVVDLIVIVMYFTLFPHFNNNQTIGMQLAKIRLNGKKLNLKTHFWRSLFIPIYTGAGFSLGINYVLNIIVILLLHGNYYFWGKFIINLICGIYCVIDIVWVLRNNGERAFHDHIFNTSVN